MAIVNTAILATNTTLYTSAGNNAITTVIICNTGGNDRTLTLHAVPSGGSAGAVNMIVNALVVPAGDTVSFDQEKMVLSNGDSLVAVGSDTGLSATVSTLPV
jgi:hypothetical protein